MEVPEIDDISDVITKIINDNFNITITKKQIKQLIEACNGDLNLLNEKVELLKKQTDIKSAVGWLIKAMKDDYKVSEFLTTEKKRRKSKINNYKGHNWDYDKLEELEQQYLINSLKDSDSEENNNLDVKNEKAFKTKINKELQANFDKEFNDVQLGNIFSICKGDFDTFKKLLVKVKKEFANDPTQKIYSLFLLTKI